MIYFSVVKTEAVGSFKTLVPIYQTTKVSHPRRQ
jgi:hypothetical protein